MVSNHMAPGVQRVHGLTNLENTGCQKRRERNVLSHELKETLTHIHQMTGLCGPILPPCVRVCKPGPSSWGLLGAEVGGDNMLRAGNVVFAFIRTHLSYGFRSNA
jgi:hypothetical protein